MTKKPVSPPRLMSIQPYYTSVAISLVCFFLATTGLSASWVALGLVAGFSLSGSV
ncbi:MAG: hypothetical protein KTU85_07970 [Acidimicrobiia bacterium]|nr:hypothetical protein [Acidimicrobiia bacterium]MCY4457452.1 hypothetical protein [Acidimicrobiaceae bacterium]